MTATWGDHAGVSITLPGTADADLAYDLGFRWLRGGSEVGWGDEERDRQLDTMRHAEARGARFIWCSNLSGHEYTSDRFGEWVEFHRDLARRGVRRFEVGNEWNNPVSFWLSPYDPTWATQAIWLQGACNAIKEVNPHATVVTGGMSPYGDDDGGNTDVNRWPHSALAKLIPRLDMRKWDGFGHHPYSHPSSPLARYPNHPGWNACLQGTQSFWFVMAVLKQSHKGLWLTEFGSGSNEFGSEEERALHFKRYFKAFRIMRGWRVPVHAMFLHTLRDNTSGEVDFGVLQEDGSDKPYTTDAVRRWLRTPW
jgi:hypothetical protein